MNLFGVFGIIAAAGGPDSFPENLVGPSIVGWNGEVPKTVSCNPGVWSGGHLTYSYNWNTGATTQEITISSTGEYYCTVRASNGAGYAEVSTNSIYVTEPPVCIGTPNVSGGSYTGDTLSCSTGGWTGYPDPTFSYLWYPTNETSNSISVITTGDYYCTVTATNGIGSPVSAQSNTVSIGEPPGGNSPGNLSVPVLSGDTAKCGVSNCSTGEWSYDPTTFEYQWFRNSSAITDATSSNYTLTSSDVGHSISCRVTATNSYGSGYSFTSDFTCTQTFDPVNNAPPVPSLSLLTVWQILGLTSVGDWSYNDGPPTVTFYKSLNSAPGVENTFIQNGYGADQTIVLDETLVGYFIEITVAYTNLCGNTTTATTGKLGPVSF